MAKKILFINAIDPYDSIQSMYPQLGLGYLVSSLRKHFGKDHFIFRIVDKDIKREIVDFKPDMICLSAVTQNYNLAKRYAKMIKKDIPIIIGGVHITMAPQSLTKDMVVGVIGEGEETIVDLVKVFDKHDAIKPELIENIPGIVFWKDGKIKYNGPRPPIAPLDKIPFPARDLLDIGDTTYVFSSRGCPYRCIFCSSSRFWNNLRFFSAEYVVKEIKLLVEKYGVKRVSFYDDLFIANKPRLKEIVSLLEKEKFPHEVSYYCSCRANLVNDDVAATLKKMNFKAVSMGLESGNERVLRYLKGGMSLLRTISTPSRY